MPTDIMKQVVGQLDAAHHLNRLSDVHPEVFNFVANALYTNEDVTPAQIAAAAAWIDDVMQKRHKVGKVKSERGREAVRENGRKGGRPPRPTE